MVELKIKLKLDYQYKSKTHLAKKITNKISFGKTREKNVKYNNNYLQKKVAYSYKSLNEILFDNFYHACYNRK